MVFWFVIKMLGKAFFILLALFGAYEALPKPAKETGGDLLKKVTKLQPKPRWFVIVFAAILAAVYVIGEIRNDWRQFKNASSESIPHLTQLRRETVGIASAIQSSLARGESGFLMMQDCGQDLNILIPKLRSNGIWTQELREVFNNIESSNTAYWTNVIKALLNAAETIKE